MTFETWFTFFIVEAVASLAPGLAVLYVISQGLRGGLRTSLDSTLGILSTNTLYFILSATSLGAIIAASTRLFAVVRYIGAAYLIFLGLKAIFAKGAALVTRMADPEPGLRIYFRGVTLQASNPKTILFFSSIVPPFIHPESSWSIPKQMTVLGATSVIPEFFILMGYGTLAGTASTLLKNPRYSAWADRAAGLLLVLVGAGLVWFNRS